MDMGVDVDMGVIVDMDMSMDVDMDMDVDVDIKMDTDSGMIFCFGSNRNKLKLDLFRFQFRLYRNETSFVGHPSINDVLVVFKRKQFPIFELVPKLANSQIHADSDPQHGLQFFSSHLSPSDRKLRPTQLPIITLKHEVR
jgi:hypothetical protein